MVKLIKRAAVLAALMTGSAGLAETNHFEVWLNPAITKSVSERTEVELETAQRFRDAGEGGRDTYFFRLWVNHKATKNLTLSAGVEQNWNDSQGEQRLLQQASYRFGVFRGRSRLEQRFVEDTDQTGFRFRQRVGVQVPLDEAGKWAAIANAEGFFTLQSTTNNGQTGLTGLRTILEVSHELSDSLEVGLGYVRNQDIRKGRPDRVGHAPLLVLTVGL